MAKAAPGLLAKNFFSGAVGDFTVAYGDDWEADFFSLLCFFVIFLHMDSPMIPKPIKPIFIFFFLSLNRHLKQIS